MEVPPEADCNKKGSKMLFLTILTFEGADRETVIKRCAPGGAKVPEGVQVLMEVVDLSKNRVFRIAELTDSKAILAANMAWSDLGKIETIPVMETQEVLETLHRMNKKEHHRKKSRNPPESDSQL